MQRFLFSLFKYSGENRLLTEQKISSVHLDKTKSQMDERFKYKRNH